MNRTLSAVAQAVGGRLVGEDRPYGAVASDSRTLPAGALFVALRGPNFDGAEFVGAAAARGAAGALVDRPVAAAVPQIVVADTLSALQSLAGQWRAEFARPLVAVAGSNGKTTTKEMPAAILARLGPCLATAGNFNNHIGVPLTLMRLEATHRSAVIELGANRVGDVAGLMRIVKPTVGLITNAGAEHLEGFGSLDGVAQGEGETVAGLAAAATAVINFDDAYAAYWRGITPARRIVGFGVQTGAEFTVKNVRQGVEEGGFVTRFTLVAPFGEREITLHAGGAHNIVNALGAAAAAAAAGASLADIAEGLSRFRPVSGRLQLKAGIHGSRIIDDSYNANPSSVRSGLEVLRSLGGATWLLLGDMAELGATSAESHAELGRHARDCGIARLFAIGKESALAAAAFGGGGEWFADSDALIRRLREELSAGVTVLVKGSRVNRLERVVVALLDGAGGAGGAGPMSAG